MLRELKSDLKQAANPEKAAFYPRFFKTGPGEYGEGDRFWGVVVPECRKVAKKYVTLPLDSLKRLLKDPIHECRLTAVLILVLKYQKADNEERQRLVDFYLDHLDWVNNWDIVDASAEKVLGRHLESRGRKVLDELADSGHLWRQRVSIIACLHFIKCDDFKDIKRLARKFLNHEHDLIHKAVGWMLREMGKRDEAELRSFLAKYGRKLPRTALRYAIEHFDKEQRRRFLDGDFD